MSASNQVLQIIQGPQLIHQQRPLLASQPGTGLQHGQAGPQQQIIASSTTTTTTLKQNKVPQQILPKPSGTAMAQNIIQQTTTTKTVVTQAKTTVPVQPQPIAQTPQQIPQFTNQQLAAAAQQAAANSGGQILLPAQHGQHLNAQPLLMSQMPVLVQQNTPQVRITSNVI